MAQSYWFFLHPSEPCDDALIQRYRDLLAKVEETDKDNTTFIKLCKGTINDLQIKQKG